MTDAQIIAIAITVLAVMVGTVFNNSRIGDINLRLSDVREVLRAEIKAHQATTELRFTQMEARMDARFGSIDRKLDELLSIVGSHDTRISKLEERPS